MTGVAHGSVGEGLGLICSGELVGRLSVDVMELIDGLIGSAGKINATMMIKNPSHDHISATSTC